MSRSLLPLASSALKSLALALVVVATLVVASKVALADTVDKCGTPNDNAQTCPNNPACPEDYECDFVLVVKPDGTKNTSCLCLVP